MVIKRDRISIRNWEKLGRFQIDRGEIMRVWTDLNGMLHMDIMVGADPDFIPPPKKTDIELHATCSHPDYEYQTTEGPRKSWNDADTPPEGDGWERNQEEGRNGWERFDYTEESYWRRKK